MGVVVVDDGSTDATGIREVAARYGARLIRHERARGPGAARNAGLAAVATPVVAFVDCDVEVRPDWLRWLLPHLADPAVAAVAPRVRAEPPAPSGPRRHLPGRTRGARLLGAFDEWHSPLDLGPVEARVRPGGRVGYVPATALVARTEAMRSVGGFDERLRFGEDVDLVWRLAEAGDADPDERQPDPDGRAADRSTAAAHQRARAGGDVRYEPTAVVTHPSRPHLLAWVRQRFDYGTSAGPLAVRHPGALAPVVVNPWTATAWAVAALGHPLPGVAVALAGTARLPDRLQGVDRPRQEALRLAATGTLGAWRPLATATVRPFWPVAVGAAVVSRRARRAVVVAAVAPAIVDWWTGPRTVPAPVAVALQLADDVAYGTGVWVGAWRARTLRPLRPRASGHR